MCAFGLLVGWLVRRWWAVALALPAALFGATLWKTPISDRDMAFLVGVPMAIGLLVGVALRKALPDQRNG
jgi:hypothetical protein